MNKSAVTWINLIQIFICLIFIKLLILTNLLIQSWFNPIPPGGAQSAGATFNFLSSWQFLVFFLDFLGEFLKFILVLDFNWKNSKNLKNFWAWSISQTGPKNEKKNIFFNLQNKLYITFKLAWSFIKLIQCIYLLCVCILRTRML